MAQEVKADESKVARKQEQDGAVRVEIIASEKCTADTDLAESRDGDSVDDREHKNPRPRISFKGPDGEERLMTILRAVIEPKNAGEIFSGVAARKAAKFAEITEELSHMRLFKTKDGGSLLAESTCEGILERELNRHGVRLLQSGPKPGCSSLDTVLFEIMKLKALGAKHAEEGRANLRQLAFKRKLEHGEDGEDGVGSDDEGSVSSRAKRAAGATFTSAFRAAFSRSVPGGLGAVANGNGQLLSMAEEMLDDRNRSTLASSSSGTASNASSQGQGAQHADAPVTAPSRVPELGGAPGEARKRGDETGDEKLARWVKQQDCLSRTLHSRAALIQALAGAHASGALSEHSRVAHIIMHLAQAGSGGLAVT